MRRRFESLLEFGRGTTATVYKATRKADGKEYAVKVFDNVDNSAADWRGLLREMVLLSTLDHPHVVKFKEAFLSSDGTACVVMELLRGDTLAETLKRQRARGQHLPEEVVWRLFLQIALALRYLHANRVCHRDLKPSNILFSDASGSCLKIVDFGLAKFMRTHLTNTLVGTPCYAAPELFQFQPYGCACDVWSLGCILHELASLQLAFQAESIRQLRAKVTRGETAPLPPQYSQELRDTLALLLATDPAERITIEQLLALPNVARRLEALQQAGAVCSGARAGGGAVPAEVLDRALRKLETQGSSELPRTASSLSRMMADLLPPPRYSAERQGDASAATPRQQAPAPAATSLPLDAVLSSPFYEASSGAGTPKSPGGGSPGVLHQAAALAALVQGSPLESPRKAAPAGSTVHALAQAHSTNAAVPAACTPGPKLHPKYAALVAASEAASRRSSTTGSDSPAKAPPSPPVVDMPAPAAAAAGGSRFRPDSPSSSIAARQASSRASSHEATVRSGSASPATVLRQAAAASIRLEEEAMLRLMTERISRLATPPASSGATPRIATAALTGAASIRQEEEAMLRLVTERIKLATPPSSSGPTPRFSSTAAAAGFPCPSPRVALQLPTPGSTRPAVQGSSQCCPSPLGPVSLHPADAPVATALDAAAVPMAAHAAAVPITSNAGSNRDRSSNATGTDLAAPRIGCRAWRLLRLFRRRSQRSQNK